MAEYSNNYTQNTTNLTVGTEVYKVSRRVSTVNQNSMDNSCIYCGAEDGTVYDYFPTYEVNSDPAKKAAIDSLWTFGGGNFTYTANLKNVDYNICFALIADTGAINEIGLDTVYQIGKPIYNKANSESSSNISVLNPIDIRKVIFFPSFNGYASGSPNAQLVNKDLKYLIDHPDDFWVTSINMTNVMWDGTEYNTPTTESQQIRPCIVGKDYFLPVCNIFPTHHYDITDYNSRKEFTQSYYGVYDNDGMPMSFSPIQANEALTYDPDSSYGGSKTANNNKYYYNYNYYVSKVQLIAPARQILKLLAYCGCYFADNNYSISGKTLNTMWNDDHIYLGEMKAGARTTGNFIKGTDILTSDTINKGEYSSQTDFNPNPTPPAPSDGDDMESMTTGFASALNGCAKYYLMSPSDMRDLITDFYTHAFAGSTMSESIISCHLCGIEPSFFLAVDDKKIKIPTLSQKTIFESEAEYSEITAVNNLIPAGHIAVPRLNNDFHDFTPYSIYEVFIPYCGWCSLPDTVAGRTIWVEYHVDIRTMSGKGIVLVEGDNGGKATCAEMAMNFGVTSPFAVIEAGLARQAAVTAGIQTAVGFASGVVGATSGHNALTVSGVGNAIQGCANGAMSSMTNYTQVQGKAGDTSDFANGRQCYLKISWSKTDEVVKNSMFGHTIGYICNEVGKLEGYSGFTVCLNPHITGIDCTEEEKEEIKNLLENGVIL